MLLHRGLLPRPGGISWYLPSMRIVPTRISQVMPIRSSIAPTGIWSSAYDQRKDDRTTLISAGVRWNSAMRGLQPIRITQPPETQSSHKQNRETKGQFSGFLSHRMSSRRKQFIHKCIRSPTQRRASARFPFDGIGLFSKRANVGGEPEFLQDFPHLVEGVRLLWPRHESGHALSNGPTSCSIVRTVLRSPSAIVHNERR
jgi:hypothetical protein